MEIEYKGGNSVVMKSGTAVLAIDPRASLFGVKDVKTDDAIEVLTETRFGIEKSKAKIVIDGPGEYEVSGVSLKGIPARRYLDTQGLDTTIYSISIAGHRVALLGNTAPKLSEDQLEGIGVIDIAILPVGGGGYTLDAHEAAALTRQLDPRIVIPVHYADKGLSYEVEQDSLEGFLKELGADQHDKAEKLKLKAGSTLPAVLTVVEVERS